MAKQKVVKNEDSVEKVGQTSTFRCEEALVAFVVREVNAEGKTVSERTSDPIKVFRASDGADIWAVVDGFIAKSAK